MEVNGAVTLLDQGSEVGVHRGGGGISIAIIDMHRYDNFVVGGG
jgi:hypothetical protein